MHLTFCRMDINHLSAIIDVCFGNLVYFAVDWLTTKATKHDLSCYSVHSWREEKEIGSYIFQEYLQERECD